MISSLHRWFFAGLALAAFTPGGLPAHEVITYSYLTAEGKTVSPPTAGHRVRIALGRGGPQELGLPSGRRVNFAAEFPRVVSVLGEALESQGYEPLKDPESAAMLVVFHWGCATPPPADEPRELWNFEARQMIALVGGRALRETTLDSERHAIFSDAADERYFVIVAAYDYAAYAADGSKRLLWRTQMSVPTDGLTPAQAWPLLVAVGARFFQRDTPWPQRTEIAVTGRVIPVFKGGEK